MVQLELPSPTEIVPADAVDAVVRALAHETEALQRELARVAGETESMRRLLGQQQGFGGAGGEDLKRRLTAVLAAWQQADDAELRDALDAARARAEDRVRLAHVEAGAIIAAARAEALRATATPPARLGAASTAPAPWPAHPSFAPTAPAVIPAAPEAPRSPFGPPAGLHVVDRAPTSDDVGPGDLLPLDDVLTTMLAALEHGEEPSSVVAMLPGPRSSGQTSGPTSEVESDAEVDPPSPTPGVDPGSPEPALDPSPGRGRRALHVLLPVIAVIVVVALCLLLLG